MQRGVDTAAEMVRCAGRKAQCGSRSACQVVAQTALGVALGILLHVLRRCCGSAGDGRAGIVGYAVLGAVHPRPIAVGAAFLATLSFLRYRWLRGEPLPPQRSRSARRLPPWGSAARQPMAALAASERGLFSLLGVMERGRMLPAEELRELSVAVNQTAATMTATANEVVSMERAIDPRRSRGHTWPPPSERSPHSWTKAVVSTTKWSPRLRNWCQRRTPGRCRARR